MGGMGWGIVMQTYRKNIKFQERDTRLGNAPSRSPTRPKGHQQQRFCRHDVIRRPRPTPHVPYPRPQPSQIHASDLHRTLREVPSKLSSFHSVQNGTWTSKGNNAYRFQNQEINSHLISLKN